jgi:hypothetical protein
MSRKNSQRSRLPFTQMFEWVMNSQAWRGLSPQSRCVYVELKRLYNGRNNGQLGFGARGAAAAIGMSASSANRFLKELEEHGFIRRQTESSFGQKRLTIEWCLTECRNDVLSEPPTKDFIYSKANEKNQTPVPPVKSLVPPVGLRRSAILVNTTGSPTVGTAGAAPAELQSHPRDTSTSKPYVGDDNGGHAQSTTRQYPELFNDVKRELGTLKSVRPESVTALAIRICTDLGAELDS